MTGRKFGRLTAIAREGSNRSGVSLWRCRCDCGAEPLILGVNLRRGDTRSCGCLHREKARQTAMSLTKHGEKRRGQPQTKEFQAWVAMNTRCSNPRQHRYERYGGRGITVCERWRHSFQQFLADVGRAPSKAHSLDRIDNDGHYEPGNVRWATKREQTLNSTHARMITFGSETLPLVDWARRVNIQSQTIAARIDVLRWPIERALNTPVKRHSPKTPRPI